MKYALFAGDTYYPAGGSEDLVGVFETVDEAKRAAESGEFDWAQIAEHLSLRTTWEGQSDQYIAKPSWKWKKVTRWPSNPGNEMEDWSETITWHSVKNKMPSVCKVVLVASVDLPYSWVAMWNSKERFLEQSTIP